MHEAYNVSQLIKITTPQQTIESITVYGKNIFVGTKQGQLLIYSYKNFREQPQLLCFNKTFSKKPVVQIQVVPLLDILISLTGTTSDSIITVYDISTVNLQQVIQVISETKGATTFALDIQQHKSLTGGVKIAVMLCVAIKKKLKTYYWKNRSFIDHKDISLKDVPSTVSYCKDKLVVGFKFSDYMSYDVTNDKSTEHFSIGKDGEPSVTRVSDTTIGLGKDLQTIVFDISKEEADSYKAITWDETPANLVYDEPYFVGLLGSEIQIRSFEPSLLIQNIPQVTKAKFIAYVKSGLMYIATSSQIWCLQAVSRMKQVALLLEEKQFQLALKVVNVSEDSEEDKARNMEQIQNLYAHDLFNKKKFTESMKVFSEISIDPCEVIKLFPNMLPKNNNSPHFKQPQGSSLQSVLKAIDLWEGIPALIQYLREVRLKLQYSENTKFVRIKSSQREQLPQIIDTTLLKCYLETNDALVSPLLRLNNCHLEESEKTLLEYKKYPELVILYQTKGLHEKALELLRTQAKVAEDSPLYGVQKTVQYLQNLGEDDIHIILKFASWVLEDSPEQGLKIFTDDLYEREQLPRPRILDFLLRNFKQLVIPYLEHVINVWKDTNPTFHNTLIHEYREKIQQSPSTNNTLLRTKLLNLLNQSNHYSLESVLVQFPFDSLYEERAIILGKLNKHEQVLSIYVTKLGDIQKAIQYCEHKYQKSGNNKDNKQVFAFLLKLLLATPEKRVGGIVPSEPIQPDVETALNLLEGNADKIPPELALKILPDSISSSRVLHYLQIALSKSLNDKRKAQMMSGLLYAEHLKIQEKRIHSQSQNVLITENHICPVCKKRFGNQSAFVRYPSGGIVHLSCHSKGATEKLS